MLSFFKTRPDQPLIQDQALINHMYKVKRVSVFSSLLIGYSIFYVCRQAFPVVKKVMLDEGIFNAEQMGTIGSLLLITYAIGKFSNGFLADRAHVARFMSTGLLCCAIVVLMLGFTTSFYVFAFLWCIHGWFQSMGAVPAGASLSQWFSNNERGTWYGIWSMSHSIGEGLSFAITATVVAFFGWRYGFWGSGIVALVAALIMYRTLADRPRTYGLPLVADYRNDHVSAEEAAAAEKMTIAQAQQEVFKNPFVWIVALASTAMYMTRYGINSWGILYLQESKEYSLIAAGLLLSVVKISETVGTILCGFLSDWFFNSKRNLITIIYCLMMVIGLGFFWSAPTTHLKDISPDLLTILTNGAPSEAVKAEFARIGYPLSDRALFIQDEKDPNAWMIREPFLGMVQVNKYRIGAIKGTPVLFQMYHMQHVLSMTIYGFGIGGLIALLGGLIAIDICSKKASGTAMGLVGIFSYVGSSIQEWVSGSLIEASKVVANGHTTHEYTSVMTFWFVCSVSALILSCFLWNAKPRD